MRKMFSWTLSFITAREKDGKSKRFWFTDQGIAIPPGVDCQKEVTFCQAAIFQVLLAVCTCVQAHFGLS